MDQNRNSNAALDNPQSGNGYFSRSSEGSARIVLILPAYNEAQTIVPTIEAFNSELPEAMIVVVDNNSSDDTALLAETAFRKLGCNGRVISEYRQGKGNAVRRAFTDIDADVYLMADADLTYPANRAKDLIKPILDGIADMVVGDRLSGGHYAIENKRSFHGVGNDLVRNLVNLLFRAKLSDIMSGYRAFSRRFVKNYPILVEGFQIETDVTLHALDKRFRIHEVPIEYKDRPTGSFSKLNTFSDGAKVIFTIVEILRHYKPFAFFIFLSMVFSLLGFLAALPVFNDWIQYRYIYHIPLAILASGLEIVAILTLGIGVVMDSIVYHSKLDFERNLLWSDNQRFDSWPG